MVILLQVATERRSAEESPPHQEATSIRWTMTTVRRDPKKVFASLRFPSRTDTNRGALMEAQELRRALVPHGIELVIVDTRLGGDIVHTVTAELDTCTAFVVFGCKDYGEDTGTPCCTYQEHSYWTSHNPVGTVIPIRMADVFRHPGARHIFTRNTLAIDWRRGDPMPGNLPEEILNVLEVARA